MIILIWCLKGTDSLLEPTIEELHFLALPRWLNFSVREVATTHKHLLSTKVQRLMQTNTEKEILYLLSSLCALLTHTISV